MIGQGTYWRLALLLPVLAPTIVLVVLGGLINLFASSDDPVERPESLGSMLRELFFEGTRSGVWPAYAIWCSGFLAWTRRFDCPRIRRALWWAPPTFAPLQAALYVVAELARGRTRDAEDYALIVAACLAASLGAGYVAVAFAHLLARVGIDTRLVREPGSNGPKRSN